MMRLASLVEVTGTLLKVPAWTCGFSLLSLKLILLRFQLLGERRQRALNYKASGNKDMK